MIRRFVSVRCQSFAEALLSTQPLLLTLLLLFTPLLFVTPMAVFAQHSEKPDASAKATTSRAAASAVEPGIKTTSTAKTSIETTFQISGTVVNGLGGAVLAHARITLAPVTARTTNSSVITGEDGRFLFRNLAAGKYSLTAEHKGFPTQSLDEHEHYSTAVAVGPNKQADNIVFQLRPECAISGTVMDEQGDPVREGQVMLFEKLLQNGTRAIRRRSQTNLDDRGAYRFGHLTPGTYFIVVTAQPWYADHNRFNQRNFRSGMGGAVASEPPPNKISPALDVAYPMTYFPQATEPDDATPITLRPGERFTGEIVLTPVPALHLQLANASTDPSQNFQAIVRQRVFGDFESFSPAQVMHGNAETVEISGIAPGHYDINLQTFNRGSQTAPSTRHAMVDVTADGTIDTSAASELAAVNGAVEFEGAGTPPLPAAIQLVEQQTNQSHGNPLSPTGKFDEFRLGPGRYGVMVPNSAGFAVKSLSATGATVTGHILEIRGAGPVQLTVLAVKGVGRVDGVVLRADRPVAGAMVVLAPKELASGSQLYRRDQSDSDGTFTLLGVLPGRYTLLAIENGWDLEWGNPEVLRRYILKGKPVQVESNGKSNVTVQAQ